MNNKASVHYTQPGGTKGFDNFLLTAAAGNNPVPVVYALNGNIMPSIQRCSPTTKVIYRRQSETFNRLPDNFFVGNPEKSAIDWLTRARDKKDRNRTLLENWKLNPADWYDPLNEPSPGTLAQAEWLNTWMLTALDIATANGMKLALFSFPTGSPDLALWQYLFPALRKGASLGAVLSLHEYSVQGSMSGGQAGNVLRYRDVYNLLPADCRMPIVITECGAGNGYDTGIEDQNWVNDLMWYNAQCCSDAYLLGFCAFQLGGYESNMVEALPAYAKAIAGFKCSGSAPAQESPDETTVPPATRLVDYDKHTWQFGVPVTHGRQIIRDGEPFASGQGVLLLYHGKNIYTENDLHEWYVATENSWNKVPGDPRTKAAGIDVSLYQSVIDWQKVRATGKSFAFIKATQGDDITDPFFVANWASAKRAGVLRGAYHYYKNNDDPIAQAKLFCSKLLSDKGELPPVVDIEDTSSLPNAAQIKQCLDAIEKTLLVRPIIYTAKWYWDNAQYGNLGAQVTWANQYDLWVASYTSIPLLPNGWSTYKFWQYSSTGAVDGVSHLPVDLNHFDGTEADLHEYAVMGDMPPVLPQVYYGLGAGTQSEITEPQAGIYGSGFSDDTRAAFKFLTLPDSGMMTDSISRVKAKNPKAWLMARLFFSVGMTKFTPHDFVDYCDIGTRAAYQAGIRDFEVHNEPNIENEGMGLSWIDGYGFGAWLKEVLDILRARYAQARFWFPGLSPNAIAPIFISQAVQTPGLSDLLFGYGYHSYWHNEQDSAWNMVDETGGLSWKKVWRMLPASEQKKPIAITEFSNNSPVVKPSDKGQQYRRYRELLKQNGVYGAFGFVLYWDSDRNREAWSRINGSSTGILEGYKKI